VIVEPFAAEPDLAFYVARPAIERAIAQVREGLEGHSARLVLLYGPPGIGKSIVLERVAHEVSATAICLRLDHAGLTIPELCSWLANELESLQLHAPAARSWSARIRGLLSRSDYDPSNPELVLARRVAECGGGAARVFALIDDADEMSSDDLRRLESVAERCADALSICVASSNEDMTAALAHSMALVRFEEPMSEHETREYIATRLSRARAPRELESQLEPRQVQRLYRFSGGNPRRLHAELSLIRIEGAWPESRERDDPAPGERQAHQGGGASPQAPPQIPVTSIESDTTGPGESKSLRTHAQSGSSSKHLASGEELASGLKEESPSREPAVSAPRRPRGAMIIGSLLLLGLLAAAALLSGDDAPPERNADASPEAAVQPSTDLPEELAETSSNRPGAREGAQRPLDASAAPALPRVESRAPEQPRDSRARAVAIRVSINADPWAMIWIDGLEAGETPLGDVLIPPGTHRFRARLPDGRVVEQSVEISERRRWVYFE